MVVRCIGNTARYLRQFEEKELLDEQFGKFGTSARSVLGLEIGRDYIVMGMSLHGGVLRYLVDSDRNDPEFYPTVLFESLENEVFFNWCFKSFKKEKKAIPTALWGYYELCNDPNHYEHLVLLEEPALQIYYKRKRELLEAYEEGYFYTELTSTFLPKPD